MNAVEGTLETGGRVHWRMAISWCGPLNLDMAAAGWRPTADNYLGRVPKVRILEAVREAKGEQSVQLIDHLKKPDMAKEAERLLEGTGWLPEPLRLADAKSGTLRQPARGETEAEALPVSSPATRRHQTLTSRNPTPSRRRDRTSGGVSPRFSFPIQRTARPPGACRGDAGFLSHPGDCHDRAGLDIAPALCGAGA